MRINGLVFIGSLLASLVAGAAVDRFALPAGDESAAPNDNWYDLSALPEELREKHADPKYLEQETRNYQSLKEAMAQMDDELASREMLPLPAGIDSVPLGAIFKADEKTHWPEQVSGGLGATLADAKAGWVLVNYWASWCAPCIRELPEMHDAASVYAELGITLLAVNTDPMEKDTPESAEAIFRKRGVEGLEPFVVNGPDLDEMLSASGQSRTGVRLPTNVLYAPGGVPYAIFQGGNTKADQVWMAPETLAFLSAITEPN
ncbi:MULTISPECIES: TlpA disulfide reductase family protein [Hyphomonas]|jgi:thiol-disulfide isomerase/thioredoxin|uniref:TlpA disulfide reductase family protein n=1 Tax=Hyphomonas TaxID=85 RepID=UPI003515F042